MQSFYSTCFCFLLIGCKNTDGSNNDGGTILFIVAIIGFFYIGAQANKKKTAEEAEKKKEGEIFYNDCLEAFKNAGIVSSNIYVVRLEYGIAVNNDLQKLAVYSANKSLSIYKRGEIISSECRITYNEFINSKTKTPAITWNTTGNTKGQIIKNFAYAELLVSVKDLGNPLLRFKFINQDSSEQYNALIKMMISKN